MTDRPIIFSGPMVWALLEGRKTQTRRLLRPQPTEAPVTCFHYVGIEVKTGRGTWEACDGAGPTFPFRRAQKELSTYAFTPAVGDRLWVREAWRTHFAFDAVAPRDLTPGSVIQYEASGPSFDEGLSGRLRPSIHMPRWASRLTLLVTGAKIERLQDISEHDARYEGIERFGPGWRKYDYIDEKLSFYPQPVGSFASLWRFIHGSTAWEANPWVVAVTFEVTKANIDTLKEAA